MTRRMRSNKTNKELKLHSNMYSMQSIIVCHTDIPAGHTGVVLPSTMLRRTLMAA